MSSDAQKAAIGNSSLAAPSIVHAERLAAQDRDCKAANDRRFDDLPLEEQVQRLRHALETLTIWLVQAQTGFGDHDADGIANLVQYGKTPPDA